MKDSKLKRLGKLRAMFDIAVNLADSQLRDQADQVLQDAREVGVEHCLLIGTDIEESPLFVSEPA